MVGVSVGTQNQVIRHLVANRDQYLANLVRIEDKARVDRPFTFNPIQVKIWPAMAPPGTRAIFLKPSQVGASSVIIADFLVDTITRPGTTSVIVAHEEFITQRLLAKAQFFYDSIPSQFKPDIHHKSAHEKTFPEINSVMYIGSARAYVFGRGEVIHNFLADEYAYWAEPDKIMVPTLQRVPPEGRVVVLSTPNGEDNSFHSLYNQGKDGSSGWRSHFYPWFDHPEYILGVDSPSALPRDRGPLQLLDERELFLMERMELTEDQIRWRRWKIAELMSLRQGGSLVPLFGQEFPEDDVTCFLTAGDMTYDPDTVNDLATKCYPAPATPQRMAHTRANVWVEPQPDLQYLVSIDPGLGKQSLTAITVWTFAPGDGDEIATHCATIGEFIEPKETADRAKMLGALYNLAVIVCEANGHGLSVLSYLTDYPNLYLRTEIATGKVSRRPGWLTTTRTKPHMLAETRKLMPWMQIHDIRVVSQFRNMRDKLTPRGVISVPIGPDDLHDSVAIAMATRESRSIQRGVVGYHGWSW